jgi:hypothetical protein
VPETDAGFDAPRAATAGAATAIRSADQALELTRTADRLPAEATAAIVHSVRSTANAAEATPVDHTPALSHHPLQMVRGVLPSGVLGIVVPGGVGDLRSPSGAPLEVGADAFSSPAMPATWRKAPAGFRSDEPISNPDNSPIRHLLEFAGVEPLPPVARGVPSSVSSGHPELAAAVFGDISASAGPVDERLANSAPPDGNGPQPAPESSQGNAPGAGGTSFVPLAALLALLALAAPAILRRLGEGPDLWPQIPFVCALERPG